MWNVKVLRKKFLLAGFILMLFSQVFYSSRLHAYEVIPVKHGGELFGTIKYKGDPPANLSNPVANNSEFCGSTVQDETYLINTENRGIENVVISFENIQQGKKPIFSTIVIENRNCHFVPHVQGAMVGDSYEIRNSDPILHNTHLHMEEQTILNVAMPAGGRNIKKPLTKAGIIHAKCDAHKFMQGWISIMDNPYFAVTDKEGKYDISNIPSGKYKVKIWHEGLLAQEEEITVLPDKKTNLSVNLTSK
ncbi:MAG: hypothetical protein HY200_03110 [Nitrospirae bacterium]|nr:hypothetical protein [Nitrospirota bacterium]MBI3593922.1 hypothetical protein [Nitrospirota bacterium]